jgi:predicted nuclease with TOPRIM domain
VVLQNETLQTELSLASEKISKLEMEIAQLSVSVDKLQMENQQLKQDLEDANESAANQLQEVFFIS